MHEMCRAAKKARCLPGIQIIAEGVPATDCFEKPSTWNLESLITGIQENSIYPATVFFGPVCFMAASVFFQQL